MALSWYRVFRLQRGLDRDGRPTLRYVPLGVVEAAHEADALNHAVRMFGLPRACLETVQCKRPPRRTAAA